MDTMAKLVELKVLIYGMKGVGVELAKNTILAGPKSVHLCDPRITTTTDIGSNYYITSRDVANKLSKAEASVGKLRELNPYVSVDSFTDFNFSLFNENDLDKLKNFDVVCITDFISKENLIKIDN